MRGEKIKKDFPIFENHPNLIYLDSAASSQKPRMVIERIKKFYEESYSNVHRGLYPLAEEATEEYEKARKKVADFINAKPEEIIFVKNSSEGLNLLAYSLRKIKKEKILTTIMEHHSNFVPWQQLYPSFSILDIDDNGELIIDEKEIKKNDIVTLTHVSNVLGTINPIKEIVKIAKEENRISIIDASQSAPHQKIDVKEIGCDFLVFTGHKIFGPSGIGVLYGRAEALEGLPPFLYGGEMIESVEIKKSSWAEIPYKFEAGTPNIAGAVGLSAAIEYIQKIGGIEKIERYLRELTKYAIGKMEEEVNIVGPKDRGPLISFYLTKFHAHDVADLLGKKGICVRAGTHCAMPLHERINISATTRASFQIYNTKEDVNKLIEGIKEIKRLVG